MSRLNFICDDRVLGFDRRQGELVAQVGRIRLAASRAAANRPCVPLSKRTSMVATLTLRTVFCSSMCIVAYGPLPQIAALQRRQRRPGQRRAGNQRRRSATPAAAISSGPSTSHDGSLDVGIRGLHSRITFQNRYMRRERQDGGTSALYVPALTAGGGWSEVVRVAQSCRCTAAGRRWRAPAGRRGAFGLDDADRRHAGGTGTRSPAPSARTRPTRRRCRRTSRRRRSRRWRRRRRRPPSRRRRRARSARRSGITATSPPSFTATVSRQRLAIAMPAEIGRPSPGRSQPGRASRP